MVNIVDASGDPSTNGPCDSIVSTGAPLTFDSTPPELLPSGVLNNAGTTHLVPALATKFGIVTPEIEPIFKVETLDVTFEASDFLVLSIANT